MPRPHVTIAVTPPRDDRTVVTVGGIGLTETEARALADHIIDTLERSTTPHD